jgi:hypothetical protein
MSKDEPESESETTAQAKRRLEEELINQQEYWRVPFRASAMP